MEIAFLPDFPENSVSKNTTHNDDPDGWPCPLQSLVSGVGFILLYTLCFQFYLRQFGGPPLLGFGLAGLLAAAYSSHAVDRIGCSRLFGNSCDWLGEYAIVPMTRNR